MHRRIRRSNLVLVGEGLDRATLAQIPKLGSAVIRPTYNKGRAPLGRAARVDKRGVFGDFFDLFTYFDILYPQGLVRACRYYLGPIGDQELCSCGLLRP
ncbi:hypothetical protein LguiB_027000 [Lonicera macranthoides]